MLHTDGSQHSDQLAVVTGINLTQLWCGYKDALRKVWSWRVVCLNFGLLTSIPEAVRFLCGLFVARRNIPHRCCPFLMLLYMYQSCRLLRSGNILNSSQPSPRQRCRQVLLPRLQLPPHAHLHQNLSLVQLLFLPP